MMTEYVVPSLALNYPCKEYKISCESVDIYLCTCMRNKYPCKNEFVWNGHIQDNHVEVDQFLNIPGVEMFPDSLPVAGDR